MYLIDVIENYWPTATASETALLREAWQIFYAEHEPNEAARRQMVLRLLDLVGELFPEGTPASPELQRTLAKFVEEQAA